MFGGEYVETVNAPDEGAGRRGPVVPLGAVFLLRVLLRAEVFHRSFDKVTEAFKETWGAALTSGRLGNMPPISSPYLPYVWLMRG